MIHKTIAIVADCDDTLAPDTTAQLLTRFGIDIEHFYRNRVGRLIDVGWDPALAYMHEILALVNEGPLQDLTKTRLEEIGSKLQLYPGVPQVFSGLRAEIEDDPRYREYDINVQYYVISGGIEDLIRASPIGGAMDWIWGCNFSYDENGRITFPRCVVSFTDKTRFLFNIQKGLVGDKSRTKPYAVNKDMNDKERPIPFSNMIYLGDGPSDIPCMSLLTKNQGCVIGIEYPEDSARTWTLGYGRRANFIEPADYRKGTSTYGRLKQALKYIADGIVMQIEYEEFRSGVPKY